MSRLALLLLAAALPTHASPIAKFARGNISITLHNAECKLKSEITNLPKRAVWVENGKPVEGCFGVSGQIGMVMFYFADKTAAAVPLSFFEPVTGA